MIVDDLRLDATEQGMARSARVRWDSDDARLHITVPEHLAAPDAADASAWLPTCLLVAMRRGEDLELDGLVSPRLLRSSDELQDLFCAYSPALRRVTVRAAGTTDPLVAPAEGRRTACCLSRGVDSMFAAARGRSQEGPIELAIFVDRFDIHHGTQTRAGEIEEARAAAATLGLDFALVEIDVRRILAPLFDWADAVGTVLAGVGHAVGGGVRHLVLASADGPYLTGPAGSSAAIDPLFSTEAVRVEHASVARNRVEKVAWLVRERPEVLPYLKVCNRDDRVDNCCECEKCVQTMIALAVAGGLERATAFTQPLDPERVAASTPILYSEGWAFLGDAVDDDPAVDPALRIAVGTAIARSMHRRTPAGPMLHSSFQMSQKRALVRLVQEGRLNPAREPALGLVRVVDRRGGRHVYGAGTVPAGELAGELGAVPASAASDLRAWLTSDARIVTDAYGIPAVRPRLAATLRWALAPLVWRGAGNGVRERLALSLQRGLSALLHPALPPAPPQQGVGIGMLHAEGGAGRVPLYGAHHPITGDQLLSTYEWEPVDLGYAGVTHLGFIDDRAPLTGHRGVAALDLPWAARRGQRVRAS